MGTRDTGEQKRLKKLYRLTAAVVVLASAAALGAYLDLSRYADRALETRAEQKIFRIDKGQSFRQTAAALKTEGLIDHPFKFRLLARLRGADKRIQAGEYLLSAEMSPGEILETMVTGKVRLLRFTVPEGSNLKQIAAIVASAGLAGGDEFMRAATDASRVKSQGIAADTFEGYLFPDTYFFPRNASAEDIVGVMVDRFHLVFSDAWKKRAAELGLSVHQVVTLASIIEKETGTPSERPIISSVFHNRLQRGMRLETDPTVIYGIENFDGNLTRKHLDTPTPYNTYRISGLPPGPIASPGKASIEAALYPTDTKYLYFVSKKDNTHQFSTNLRDHNRAIQAYQLRR